jgi:hypothetical protein
MLFGVGEHLDLYKDLVSRKEIGLVEQLVPRFACLGAIVMLTAPHAHKTGRRREAAYPCFRWRT